MKGKRTLQSSTLKLIEFYNRKFQPVAALNKLEAWKLKAVSLASSIGSDDVVLAVWQEVKAYSRHCFFLLEIQFLQFFTLNRVFFINFDSTLKVYRSFESNLCELQTI